jgi:hypothetical protein
LRRVGVCELRYHRNRTRRYGCGARLGDAREAIVVGCAGYFCRVDMHADWMPTNGKCTYIRSLYSGRGAFEKREPSLLVSIFLYAVGDGTR